MATSGKLMKPMGFHPQGWKKINVYSCIYTKLLVTLQPPKVHSGCIYFMN